MLVDNKAIKIAKKDLRLLVKERTFILVLLIFFLMSTASTYIGWSAQQTIQQVYQATVQELIKDGKTVPPSPFSLIPALDIMKNMIIYVVLIGALLSIVLGYTIAINDRKAGATRLLFSRPFSKKNFLFGKIGAVSILLFFALFLSLIISTISVALFHSISLQLFFSIMIFYGVSFLYLAGFACLGLFFGLKTDNSTKAIILPLLCWIILTFMLPELGSALYPTSSLNPVLPTTTVLESPALQTIHSVIYPFSISEHYKDFSATALGLTNTTGTSIIVYPQEINLLILFVWLFLTLGLSYYAMKKFDSAQGDNYE
jgi:ABC-type transport system involved in multi-copper enzyme maturation permease subunit